MADFAVSVAIKSFEKHLNLDVCGVVFVLQHDMFEVLKVKGVLVIYIEVRKGIS
jgi:hypothetical protein